jgi:hypothetical protein
VEHTARTSTLLPSPAGDGDGRRRIHVAPATVSVPISHRGYTLHPGHPNLFTPTNSKRTLIVRLCVNQSLPRRWCWGIPVQSAGRRAFHAERRRRFVFYPCFPLFS